MEAENPWMKAFPFNSRNLLIRPTFEQISLKGDLSEFVQEYVKKTGINFNSWVPFVNFVDFGKTHVTLHTGAIDYKSVKGLTQAFVEKVAFAPQIGFNPALSIGFITKTSDGKIILQRRPEGVHCPNTVISEPCGYMSSGYISPRPVKTDDPAVILNPRLYDVQAQLNTRRNEVASTFGVSPDLVRYNHIQDFLGCGWRTVEMYLSTTGRINATEDELKDSRSKMIDEMEKQGQQEIEQGKGDGKVKKAEKMRGAEFYFVPSSNLKGLLYNQSNLLKVSLEGYRPERVEEMPLLDETFLGIMYGYEKLTGNSLDVKDVARNMRTSGLDFQICDTSPDTRYSFSINSR